MGAKTGISWADATWSPIIGCSMVSDGCVNCYAARIAARFCQSGDYYDGLVIPLTKPTRNGLWTGNIIRKNPKFNPLTARKPRTIFVCSMGDLFHPSVPDEWIDEVMAVIALTPHHRYMVLTKRPERMHEYFGPRACRISKVAAAAGYTMDDGDTAYASVINTKWPLPNLALGVSIESQAWADVRVPILLQTPAVKRFVSIEPALGPVDLRYLQPTDPPTEINALEGTHGVLRPHGGKCDKLDLVIMGGESGPNARPMRHDWARLMRDQCQTFGVPFHFKSWGEYCYPSQMPEEIFRARAWARYREYHAQALARRHKSLRSLARWS